MRRQQLLQMRELTPSQHAEVFAETARIPPAVVVGHEIQRHAARDEAFEVVDEQSGERAAGQPEPTAAAVDHQQAEMQRGIVALRIVGGERVTHRRGKRLDPRRRFETGLDVGDAGAREVVGERNDETIHPPIVRRQCLGDDRPALVVRGRHRRIRRQAQTLARIRRRVAGVARQRHRQRLNRAVAVCIAYSHERVFQLGITRPVARRRMATVVRARQLRRRRDQLAPQERRFAQLRRQVGEIVKQPARRADAVVDEVARVRHQVTARRATTPPPVAAT